MPVVYFFSHLLELLGFFYRVSPRVIGLDGIWWDCCFLLFFFTTQLVVDAGAVPRREKGKKREKETKK